MYVDVKYGDTAAAVVELGDLDDLTRFSVRAPKGSSPEWIATSLLSEGAGSLAGDEASIKVEWLRNCTAARSNEWRADFARMLAYARSRGWTDPGETMVVAHIEPV